MLAVDGTTMVGIILGVLVDVVVISLLLRLAWIPLRNWYARIDDDHRSRTPGRVPRGVPTVATSSKGFGWLARNEYGAIDMSQYTPAQWRDTGLKYCERHHKHPGEAVHMTTLFDDFGNAFWDDPCECGKVMNVLRAVICRDGLYGQWLNATVSYTVLNGIQHAFANPNPVDGLEKSLKSDAVFAGAAFGVVALRNRALRNLVQRLWVHPEIDGIWVDSVWAFERYGTRDLWRRMGAFPQDRRWDGERWTAPYYPPQPEPELPPTWGGPSNLAWGKKW